MPLKCIQFFAIIVLIRTQSVWISSRRKRSPDRAIVNYGEGGLQLATKKLTEPERRIVGLQVFRPDAQTSYI